MDRKSIGALMLLAGLVILACGLFLKKKFDAKANHRGIGSFRFTSVGFAWLAGYLLFILGFCVVLVSLMVLFL